jgi:deoxycytidylate deaminase
MLEYLTATDRRRRKFRIFCDLADSLAGMSVCRRLSVGCVIVTPTLTEVLAIGYNGPASEEPDEACLDREGACQCCHAEANALVKLLTPRSDLLMIITHSPCAPCAGLIINSKRVRSVLYGLDYRDPSGRLRLERARVVCQSWDSILGVE